MAKKKALLKDSEKVSLRRKKELIKSLSKLKLRKAVKEVLYGIVITLEDAHVEQESALVSEIMMWRRLYLDQPEDRLYHAKDKTWWRRLHGPELKAAEARNPGSVHSFSLYSADPPPDVQRLAVAAHAVIQRTRRLNKPHLMELWNALKPFGVIPTAIYVNPQEMSDAVGTTKKP